MPPKKTKKDNILYLGIDLGTSRSAVSASNGERKWVDSYVGWPQDFVARKLLGDRVLVGEEAMEHELSVNLIRPLEFGVIRDGTARAEEAVRELIHHVIRLAKPEEGQAIHAGVGVPAEALRVNKIAIRDAVKEYADALMIMSEPFAVAYGLGALNNSLIIDIGAGTVDFCVMHGTMPAEGDQRTLNTGGDYVDGVLYEMLAETYPEARFTPNSVRRFKEEHGLVGSQKEKVKVKVPVNGKMTEFDVTDVLRRACERLLPPIVETAIDLISRYEPEFQEQVKRNIYIAGGGSQIKGIADALEDELKQYGRCKVTTVNDPLFAGADGALALAQDMPEDYWEEM